MVARPANPYRSANAGEFSPDAKGRVDIKQYYSGGLAYKNVEPVPQSGYRQMGGTLRKGKVRRPLGGRAIGSPATDPGPHTGTQTIWTGNVASGPICAVFVLDIDVSAGALTYAVEGQTSPGVWTPIGKPMVILAGAPQSRTSGAPPGEPVICNALRIRGTFTVAASISLTSVTAFEEIGTAVAPRYVKLTTDNGNVLSCLVTAGMADFYSDLGFEGSARLNQISPAMLPDLDFYAEGRTIGIFHGTMISQRMFLENVGGKHEWSVDPWPYDPAPTADLGGVYPKTNDVWRIFIRWTGTVTLFMSLTIDQETTEAIPHTSNGVTIINSGAFDAASWTQWASDLQTAINALPSGAGGVTVAHGGIGADSGGFIITFAGASAGREYQLSALIANTTDASAVTYHIGVGATTYEPLFSVARGWPGTVDLVQDRIAYGRIPAVRGALALSRVGEYFDLNDKAKDDAAARLDKIRSQTSETIVSVKESKYLLVFTDRGVYFANNRTIERNVPLNFVLASEIGAQPNCRAFDLEGLLYYVAGNPQGIQFKASGGKQLLSLEYDDVSTTYNAKQESLLASHLVAGVMRSVRQSATDDLDASKGWLMRADGRLIAAQLIKNQEIVGFCEWIAADGGDVVEIGIDGQNRLWLAVKRGTDITVEMYDTTIFLQDAQTKVPDLAGDIAGLDYPDGTVLWAVADGYVVGPLTVAAGSVSLGDSYASALVGRWQAPRWESMPQVYVSPSDDVILRPGRIHTAYLNIVDTTSIAVGANGEAPQDIKLLEATDLVDQPMPAKSKLLTVSGEDLPGMVEGTTLVVTQTLPGQFRVRDLAMGAKL